QEEGHVVTSPIVGTFYSAASPDNPPFVQVGDCVTPSTVLFIIESMKLMNEITSQFSGCVVEILVKNGEAVEFGQPIMRIN
ncbi:MAG: biotin/lipoyl-containing protein, partial [Oscillospiraceae bacterium]